MIDCTQMITDALTLYFRSPVDWDYVSQTFISHRDAESEEEASRRDA